MDDLKISLITVAFNAENTISRCVDSVIAQNYKNIEYIIIDGGSTDNTIKIINSYKEGVSIFLSEPDAGIYDAMNKGIKLATGDIVGTLNADDFFAADDILSAITVAFAQQNADIIYGDLDYVDSDGRLFRKWRSKQYKPGMFNYGWMPPHPTFYCKRIFFTRFRNYSLEFGTAADYEFMLRLMHLNSLNAVYIKRVLVKMKIGGISNKSLNNRVQGSLFDLKAMRKNGIWIPIITILLKPLRKITQYFF